METTQSARAQLLFEKEQLYRQKLTELARLERSDGVRRQTSSAWMDLADVLRDQGNYSGAKEAYQAGLEISEKLGDKREVAVSKSQLGTLARRQAELVEAEECCKEAITLFRSIGEPMQEAMNTHNLGIVYQQAEQWEAAEQAYRQAARLMEEQGLLGGNVSAAASWQQLAQICGYTGRHEEAEQWFRKALKALRAADEQPGIARTLNNLASLLANNPARLDEARAYAEEALAISESLDPAAMQIWMTYTLLARIADQQGDSSQAAEYRARSRQAYLASPGWQQQLQENEAIIYAVVEACITPELQDELEAGLEELIELGWEDLVEAIQRILDGERDEDTLCESLDYEDGAVIHAILEGIKEKG